MRQRKLAIAATALVIALVVVQWGDGQEEGTVSNAFLLDNQTNNTAGGALSDRSPGTWVYRAVVAHGEAGVDVASGFETQLPDLLDVILAPIGGGEGDGILQTLLIGLIELIFDGINQSLVDFLTDLGTLPAAP
jgi:hypothetical protein